MNTYYERYWEENNRDELNDFRYKWPIIKRVLSNVKNEKILDFGCGAGQLLKEVVSYFPDNHYVGTDLSLEGIKRARKKLPNIKFLKTEGGKNLPFSDNEFDTVLATDVIEHVYDIPVLLSEWNRILKRGGKIVITTPYFGFIKNVVICLIKFEKVFDTTGPHIRFFTDNSLKRTLEKFGFKTIETIHFGRFYPLSNGVLMVARKTK